MFSKQVLLFEVCGFKNCKMNESLQRIANSVYLCKKCVCSNFWFIIQECARNSSSPFQYSPTRLRPVQYSYEITDTMAKFSKFYTEIMNIFLVILSDCILISFKFKFQFSFANNSNLPFGYQSDKIKLAFTDYSGKKTCYFLDNFKENQD